MTNAEPIKVIHTSHASKVPAVIRDYFNSDRVHLRETFTPGKGWRRSAPRISQRGLRLMRDAGVTMIAVEHESGRVADFSIEEVTRRPRVSVADVVNAIIDTQPDESEVGHYALVISNRYGPETDEDRGRMTLEAAKEYASNIVEGQDPAFGAWANQVNIYPIDADGEVNYGVDPIASRSRY